MSIEGWKHVMHEFFIHNKEFLISDYAVIMDTYM